MVMQECDYSIAFRLNLILKQNQPASHPWLDYLTSFPHARPKMKTKIPNTILATADTRKEKPGKKIKNMKLSQRRKTAFSV